MQPMPGNRPYTIALTGGPCAGKTTLLNQLRGMESIAGFEPLFVPEAATILVGRGLVIGQDVVHFQTETLRLQLELENAALREAGTLGRACVIICDRGTLDGAGYCTRAEFDAIAAGFGQSRVSLAQRYDLVVHLVSAAVEAPAAYTTGNNEARGETLEQAVAQEQRTLEAWAEHPNRVIVGCPESFPEKTARARAAIEQALRHAGAKATPRSNVEPD